MTTEAPIDVHALAAELLEATSADAGRAARTLPHPIDGLRQTVIALRGGEGLGEHEGPASLLVIRGRVRLVAGDRTIDLATHEFSPIPDRRHSVHADEDAVILLNVAVPDRAPVAH